MTNKTIADIHKWAGYRAVAQPKYSTVSDQISAWANHKFGNSPNPSLDAASAVKTSTVGKTNGSLNNQYKATGAMIQPDYKNCLTPWNATQLIEENTVQDCCGLIEKECKCAAA